MGLVIGTEYIVLTTCSHGNTCCRMSSTRMDAVDMATQFVVVIGSIALRQDKPVCFRHNKELIINLVNPFWALSSVKLNLFF